MKVLVLLPRQVNVCFQECARGLRESPLLSGVSSKKKNMLGHGNRNMCSRLTAPAKAELVLPQNLAPMGSSEKCGLLLPLSASIPREFRWETKLLAPGRGSRCPHYVLQLMGRGCSHIPPCSDLLKDFILLPVLSGCYGYTQQDNACHRRARKGMMPFKLSQQSGAHISSSGALSCLAKAG